MTMTYPINIRLEVHSWILSVVVHVAAVLAAVLFVPLIQAPPLKEPFTWDVSLVSPVPEAVSQDSEESPNPAEPAEAMPPAAVQAAHEPVQSVPQVMTRHVAKSEAPTVVQRDTPQLVEQPKPALATPPVTERDRPEPEPVQGIEQRRVEEPVERHVQATVHDRLEQESPRAETAHREAVTERAEPTTSPAAAAASSSEPAVTERTVQEPTAVPPVPTESVATAAPSPEVPSNSTSQTSVVPEPQTAATMEKPAQVAKAAPSGPQAKVDTRWLAESLWRRVAELKRYPHAARLNGLQGKVVLKAIIRSDGHLAEVSVQKSSGHNVLDEAAMETVKLACPLHMKHELGTPQIVVSLPIVFSLAN
ncbi:MAG TPA: TonB family protein [Nitrospira sp.]|nr:TonB family protein [Nitrospira sp.]